MSASNIELSIVILCYREEERVPIFLNKVISILNTLEVPWEIILVGNYLEGSQDQTPRIVREIANNNPKIKALTLPKKGWMGWDARIGLEACSGNVLGFVDGDDQMEANDIAKAYQFISRFRYDMALPYRAVRLDSFLRKINSKIFNMIYNLLFPSSERIKDVNGKPKLFTRAAYQKMKLESDDWFLDAEMMIQARRHHFKIGQFRTIFHHARGRKSYVRVGAITEFLKNLIYARWKEWMQK